VKPADEQVAVWKLHDHRRMVVPVLERKKQLGGEEGAIVGLGSIAGELAAEGRKGHGREDQQCSHHGKDPES
jgi:hypothetical protein